MVHEFKPKVWMSCPLCNKQSPMPDPDRKEWVGLMKGVRVEGDTVVISTKDNDAARELCGALIEEMNK